MSVLFVGHQLSCCGGLCRCVDCNACACAVPALANARSAAYQGEVRSVAMYTILLSYYLCDASCGELEASMLLKKHSFSTYNDVIPSCKLHGFGQN